MTVIMVMPADVKFTRVFPRCEQFLYGASLAMRRHATLMETAITLSRTEHSEKERQRFKAMLDATFNEAQAAWDAYRNHLVEHGILSPA